MERENDGKRKENNLKTRRIIMYKNESKELCK